MTTASTQIPGASGSSSTAASSAASAAIFKRLHPAQYISRFLAESYRPDGRKAQAWRDVNVNIGSISTADGSALVRLGNTTVVCGIKAEIAEPETSTPSAGYIVPNVDLPAICSPRFKPGPPGDEAQTYSNWLNELLVSSNTLPASSLVIAPGKAVWCIYIDAVCINYDGNAFDAVVLSVMAALRNTRLPRATYDEDTGRTTCSRDDKFPLPLGRIPLSCSFGIFQSSYLLPDPTSLEADHLPTGITIALDQHSRACLVRQEGLGGVIGKSGIEVLDEAWALTEKRVKYLREVLESSE